MAAELNAKRLEILRDTIPGLQRVAIIANPEHPGSQIERTYSEETARKLGLTTEFFGTATDGQLTSALGAMDKSPPQAISLFADGFAIQYRRRIIDYGMKHRAPIISGWPVFARSGAICSYGPKLSESYRRLALRNSAIGIANRTADKIRDCSESEDREGPGLTVPDSIIASADELIE
jgi:putative ABC transport system substrate-binding protein